RRRAEFGGGLAEMVQELEGLGEVRVLGEEGGAVDGAARAQGGQGRIEGGGHRLLTHGGTGHRGRSRGRERAMRAIVAREGLGFNGDGNYLTPSPLSEAERGSRRSVDCAVREVGASPAGPGKARSPPARRLARAGRGRWRALESMRLGGAAEARPGRFG